MEVKQAVVNALEEAGIMLSEAEINSENLDLSDYFQDSLQFISFVFALEQNLNIELPGHLMNYSALSNVGEFMASLEKIKGAVNV